MKFLRSLCWLGLLLALPACKAQRTVLAGPTVTGLEAQGPRSAQSHFGNDDPSGYQKNANGGLNAMSEQMFGGKLQSQSQKEFAASKNFLTREYGGKKEYAAKSWRGEPKNKIWTDKLFDTQDTAESQSAYHDGTREAAIRDSPDASKTARTGDYAGGNRTARTGNYRPAEKALSNGRDKPKLTSARADRMSSGEKEIHDRIANSNASASDINKYLGKP